MRLAALLVSLSIAAPAWAQVVIENPWSRATPPAAKIGVGYMTIRNQSPSADHLLSVRSAVAARVETHVTVRDGDISRMKEVKGYDIPPKGSFELKPGGAHLMLIDLKAPLKQGDVVPIVLSFQKAGEVKTELHVGPLGGSGPMQMKH